MIESAPALERRGLIPPQQKRSEQTLARILDGARSLLASRELAAISMEEVAAAAGVSVGAIYRRFRSRDDLMDALLRDLQVRQLDALDAALAPALWEGVGLEARLDWIIAQQAQAAAGAAGLIRAVFSALLASTAPGADETARLNAETSARLVAWLLQARDEVGAPDPEATTRVVVAQLSISLNLARLYPASFAPMGPDEVVPILKRTALAALRGG